MTPELIALTMFGLLLLGLFMGHPLAFVLGGTAVLGAVIAGKPMVHRTRARLRARLAPRAAQLLRVLLAPYFIFFVL